jgi:hypothetical protein
MNPAALKFISSRPVVEQLHRTWQRPPLVV